jgi:pilus assembly protein Flp/PilA
MLTTLSALMKGLRDDEEGATIEEYGLLVAMVAMVALIGVTILGGNLESLFNTIAAAI